MLLHVRQFLAYSAAALLLSGTTLRAEVTLIQDGTAKFAIHVDPAVWGDGKPPAASIHWSDNKPESLQLRLRESVLDLAAYLERISGTKVEVKPGEPEAGDSRLALRIGSLAEKKWGQVAAKGTMKQAFRIVVKPEGVGLWGESDLSSSYAIYTLLHELGCRWFMPGPMGEYVPSSKSIVLKERDQSSQPYSHYRGIWYADTHYSRRNRLGGLVLNAGHALEHYVTAQQRKDHPEWIGTVEGKPHPFRLRWSAPGLAEAIAEHLIAEKAKNPTTVSFSLSPEDGLGYDDSEQDKALDANDFDPSFQGISITDRQVLFCNKIAAKVSEKHPDLLFGMLAYGVSTRPPVREKMHANLIPQIAPITYSRVHPMTDDGEPNNKSLRALVEGWGRASPAVSYYYYAFYLAEPAAPNPFIQKWSVDVPMAFKHNCRFWQPETIANFETAMHAIYLGTRLSWDPNQKPEEIFEELHRLYYGHAAQEMAAYWSYIDNVWVGTPEYSGCGFGHLRRFGGQKIAKARELLNRAIAKTRTPEEKFRVSMADDSLKLFELFVKLRGDLNEGRFATLSADADRYMKMVTELGGKYSAQFAFGRMGWTGDMGIYGRYFQAFYEKTYKDATNIAATGVLLSDKPLQEWKWQTDKEKKGEAAGWHSSQFDDSAWKSTNPGIDTWSWIGLHNEMGSVWYRHQVDVPEVPAGKKIFLWLGATDGSAKVFVNGKPVAYKNEKGEESPQFENYCVPASFDVTAHLKSGAKNTIAIFTTRTFMNELGTGGLIAPVTLYRQR